MNSVVMQHGAGDGHDNSDSFFVRQSHHWIGVHQSGGVVAQVFYDTVNPICF